MTLPATWTGRRRAAGALPRSRRWASLRPSGRSAGCPR